MKRNEGNETNFLVMCSHKCDPESVAMHGTFQKTAVVSRSHVIRVTEWTRCNYKIQDQTWFHGRTLTNLSLCHTCWGIGIPLRLNNNNHISQATDKTGLQILTSPSRHQRIKTWINLTTPAESDQYHLLPNPYYCRLPFMTTSPLIWHTNLRIWNSIFNKVENCPLRMTGNLKLYLKHIFIEECTGET